MVEENKVSAPRRADRLVWARPEVRRMEAGGAETQFTSGTDGATQNS